MLIDVTRKFDDKKGTRDKGLGTSRKNPFMTKMKNPFRDLPSVERRSE
jgi:hypothetical protein